MGLNKYELSESYNIATLFYSALNAGVSMASLTELSFNWLGFISAMISNISFTYRSIYSKKAMVIFKIKLIDSLCVDDLKPFFLMAAVSIAD